MTKFDCAICHKNHATQEHRIYEKLRLAESGVSIKTLFIMPNETTGNPDVDSRLKEIRSIAND